MDWLTESHNLVYGKDEEGMVMEEEEEEEDEAVEERWNQKRCLQRQRKEKEEAIEGDVRKWLSQVGRWDRNQAYGRSVFGQHAKALNG